LALLDFPELIKKPRNVPAALEELKCSTVARIGNIYNVTG
jgi:hypothetical protein